MDTSCSTLISNALSVSRLRSEFKQLLEETGYVTPGKKLEEVRVLFMGRECWEALPEQERSAGKIFTHLPKNICQFPQLLTQSFAFRQQIYELHQQDLILRCKKNFQELLLEKADLFYQFRSSPAGTVTQVHFRYFYIDTFGTITASQKYQNKVKIKQLFPLGRHHGDHRHAGRGRQVQGPRQTGR